jgi:hypothetical protein
MKIEKYLIHKKNTNKIEGLISGGMGSGEEKVLIDIEYSLNHAIFYNSFREAQDEIINKRKLCDEYPNSMALYYYDDITKPDDLSILKVTIEDCD